MNCGKIYMLWCSVTNKCYIGKTISKFEYRKSQHTHLINKQKHPNKKLQSAVLKYGWNKFKWFILQDYIKTEKLDKLEIDWIKKFNSCDNGYKLNFGGDGALIGSKNPNTKFSDRNVLDIVNDYISNNFTCEELSSKYNSPRSTISSILQGRSWSHLFNDDTYLKIKQVRNTRRISKNAIPIEINEKQFSSKLDAAKSLGYKSGDSINYRLARGDKFGKRKICTFRKRIIADDICFYSCLNATKYFEHKSTSSIYKWLKSGRAKYID